MQSYAEAGGSIIEKLPPHDIEAEEAVVASILVDPESVFKVMTILQSQDFFRERNAWAYEACIDLFERGEAINQITVAHELSRRDRLEPAGGLSFLMRLTAELPTPAGVEFYAQIVQRDATYRRLIQASAQMTQLAYEGGPDLDSVLAKSETLLMALRNGERLRDFVHIRQLLEDYLEDPGPDAGGSVLSHVRTGFMDLDTLLNGLKRSDLAIIAARPSLGKSSLAFNMVRNAAVGQRAKCAIFSLEMSAEQVAQRFLSSESQVDSTRLRLGEHTETEERKIMRAMGVLADADIYVDDTPVQRVSEIRAKARRLAHEKGLDLLVIDYLQLIHGDSRNDNRVQEISHISRTLKEIARELDVPVIACAQLSRAVEQRTPHIPMLSDLRESGSIEQDADIVMFIYREDAYVRKDEWQNLNPDRPGESYPQGLAQLIIAKHRNGPTGTVHLRFRNNLAKFEDLLILEEDD